MGPYFRRSQSCADPLPDPLAFHLGASPTAVNDPVETARRKISDAYARAPKVARRRFADEHRDELLELLGEEVSIESDEAPEIDAETDAEIVPFTARKQG